MERGWLALTLTLAAAGCGGRASPRVAEVVTPPAGSPIAGTEPATLQLDRAHAGTVRHVAWSPDGRRLATQTWPPEAVRIWDVEHGRLLREIPVPSQDWRGVAWSGDGAQLAIMTTHEARVIDVDRGTTVDLGLADDEVPITGVPGAGWLVERYGKRAVVDGAARTALADQPSTDDDTIVVAPDGAVIAALSDDNRELVWWRIADATTGRISLGDYAQGALALAGGVIGAWNRDRIALFDDRGQSYKTIALADDPSTVTIASDVGWVAATSYLELRLTDAAGAAIATVADAEAAGRVITMTSSPDGTRLALGGDAGAVAIVDPRSGAVLHRLGYPVAAPVDVAFLAEDRLLVATTRGLVTFDLGAPGLDGDLPIAGVETIGGLPGQGFVVTSRAAWADAPCAWAPPEVQAAYTQFAIRGAAGATLPAPADPSGGATRAIRMRRKASAATTTATAAWTPPDWTMCLPTSTRIDGASAASGRALIEEPRVGDDKVRLGVVDAADATTARWLEPAMPFWSNVTLSRDGRRAFAIGQDIANGTTGYGLWDVDARTMLHQGGPLPLGVVGALSGDGAWFALALGNTVVPLAVATPAAELDAALKRDVVTFPQGAIISHVEVGDDGLVVAVSAANDLFVARAATQLGHGVLAGAIRRVVIGPGDAPIATISDGAVQLWRRDGTRLLDLHVFQDGEWIAVAPDGVYAASFEASRRMAWRFDAPLASVDLARYGARYADRAELARRLSGEPDRAAQTPPRPPRIRWRGAPARDGEQVEIALDVERATAVLVFADGTPVAQLDVTADRVDATIEVPGGARTLVAAAYAADGLASSSEQVELAPSHAEPPKLWVVAVGVSDYPGLPFGAQLHTADDDARALADALALHAGGGATYREGAFTVLTDDAVTRDALDAALAGLADMAPTDVAVVAFAGHGIDDDGRTVLLLPAADLDDPLGPDEAIGWDEIGARLAAAKGRVLVLLDACHTGAVSQDAVALPSDLAGALVDDGRAGTVVLAAAKGRQVSLEGAWGGVFTTAVIDALGAGGELWVTELVTRVASKVGAETEDAQTPWLVRAEVFGDFPLITAPARDPAPAAGPARPIR